MKPEIERLEKAADAVLAELAESRNTGRLLAEAVMNRHVGFVDDKTGHPYYQCIHCNGEYQDYEYQDYEYQKGEIKHKEGCLVLTAMYLLGEMTET